MTVPTALWVTPVSDLGGVARHLIDVAEVGIPGWRVIFLVPPGPLVGRLRSVGAAVIEEPMGSNGHRPLEAWSALRRAVRTTRPAIVHSHLARADLTTASAWMHGPALVSTEHGISDDAALYSNSSLDAAAMRLAHGARLRRTDAVIAVSAATERSIRARWHPGGALPVHVVHNGADPVAAMAEPNAAGPIRMATLSRLAPEKGLSTSLEVFARVHQRCEAVLTVAGTGPLDDELRAEAASLGIADDVQFVGHVDADDLLSRTDILLQLSLWENCSYSLLDALRLGCGVVATDVGGNAELVPTRCLAAVGDVAAAAAAVLDQHDPSTRPTLPSDWPTRAEMCARISTIYGEMG